MCLEHSPGYVFWLKKFKNDIEIAYYLLVLSYRKIVSEFTIQYIPVKEKDVAL